MSPWVINWTYWGLLFVLAVFYAVKGSAPMRRTAITIVLVAMLEFVFAKHIAQSETLEHAWFMLLVDCLACIVITVRPAGKWQSVIGLSYIFQIGAHAGRIIAANPDINVYGNGLTLLAFMQLALLGGWIASDRPGLLSRGGDHRPLSPEARQEGVV